MCTFGKGGAIVPHQHSSSVKLSNQCKQGKGKPYIRRGMKQHTLKSQTIIFRNRCLAWALYVTTRRTACRLVPKTHTRRKKKLLARQCRVLVFAGTQTSMWSKMCARWIIVALTHWVISCQRHKGSHGWRLAMNQWGVWCHFCSGCIAAKCINLSAFDTNVFFHFHLKLQYCD